MTLPQFLAFEMAAFLAMNSATAPPRVLGVVSGADRAHVNAGAVSEGATVYDGDLFSTELGGALRVRGDRVALDLSEESTVLVRAKENGVPGAEAELNKGTLLFSTEHGALGIAALGAHVEPSADARTAAQVSITGPRELRIYARRGALQFSYRGESETIAEGTAYRVLLDPREDEREKKDAIKAGRQRKTFLLVALAAAATGVAAAVISHENHGHKHMESPDRP